ncbi:MAG TPA: hypothetical protein VHC63_10875 [Acidimicrobiales bacterium]|nr:hypothetical protein [Acidimicrobiales bacterium]
MHVRIRHASAVLALALLAGACGGGGGVGQGLKANGKQGGEGAIGQATTTTAVVVVTTAAPTVTTAKPTVTTVAVPSAVYTINSDTNGQYIEPLSHGVRAGSLVRFHNADSIAHVIDGKIGGTVVMGPSPSIAPNTDWDVRPTVRGTYDIVDEQRPYAAGVTLTVSG